MHCGRRMRALRTSAVLLLAAVFAPGVAQLSFSPVFPVSQYDTEEGRDVVVRLSESILTVPGIPRFTGSISVDIIAEDLPAGGTFNSATFGIDYIVNLENPTSRIFTVNFQPLQSNSTENVIQISEDSILEGRECFRLRLVEVRVTGLAAALFIPQEGLTNTFVDVCIEDNDVVCFNWTMQAITVTEGDNNMTVELRAAAYGIYANEIAIGVICSETIATDVEPAFPGRDFNFTVGTKLHFRDFGTTQSISADEVVIPIINDGIAEPRESFICTLQGGAVYSPCTFFPNQVTIEIRDDDGACTSELCAKEKTALCTITGAEGTCTDQMTSCKACYFASEERPLPSKCSTDIKKYNCGGRTGSKLKKCLKRWGKCLKTAFKDIYGKTPKSEEKEMLFKCPEFPCSS